MLRRRRSVLASSLLILATVGLGCGPVVEDEQSSGAASQDGDTTGTRPDDSGGDVEPDADGRVDCSRVSGDAPTVGPGAPGPLGFPEAWCDARIPPLGDGGSHRCCSDDPAAFDDGLPRYAEGTGDAEPLFSGDDNDRSASGMCVRVEDIPPGSGLPNGCPIPCNPAWAETAIETVCGVGRSCCQTRKIQPEDCVFADGSWRPATGHDIFTAPQLSNWSSGEHETHQDPGAGGCLGYGGGDVAAEAFRGCARALATAKERGFCMLVEQCPSDPSTGYLDACEEINEGLIDPPV